MSDTLTLEHGPIDTSQDEGWIAPTSGMRRNWTLEMARSALCHIHPDCDFPNDAFDRDPLSPYQLWRNINSALIGNFGKDNPETFLLVDDWSSGRLAEIQARHYKPDSIRGQYAKFDPSPSSMGTVEFWAKKGLLMPGKWNPDGDLLDRLQSFAGTDSKSKNRLLDEVAQASLSPLDLEAALKALMRITGAGKTVLTRELDVRRKAQSKTGEAGRVSAADVLIEIGLECELWKSTDPKPQLFATIDRGKNLEHLRIGSDYFRHYLNHRFFDQTNKALPKDAMSQALAVLAGRAQEKGTRFDAFLRIASAKDAIYVDLADEDNNVVEITTEGWGLVKRPEKPARGQYRTT